MKLNVGVKVLLFTSFVTLLGACRLSGLAPAAAQQSPLRQAESPLPVVANHADATGAYRVLTRLEEHRTQSDGSILHSIVEDNYYRTPSANQYGYNAHHIYSVTLSNPESSMQGVMSEMYLVDDLVFTYCTSCADAAEGGWSVSERTTVYAEGMNPAPVELGIGLVPLATLVKQSAVVGTESINGISTTHYRLGASQTLSEVVRVRIGGAPNDPLEITMAHIDIWLSADEQKPIQYTFTAEGKAEVIAGSQVLQPFTILDQYTFTQIDSAILITVPPEVLSTVEAQQKALENK